MSATVVGSKPVNGHVEARPLEVFVVLENDATHLPGTTERYIYY